MRHCGLPISLSAVHLFGFCGNVNYQLENIDFHVSQNSVQQENENYNLPASSAMQG